MATMRLAVPSSDGETWFMPFQRFAETVMHPRAHKVSELTQVLSTIREQSNRVQVQKAFHPPIKAIAKAITSYSTDVANAKAAIDKHEQDKKDSIFTVLKHFGLEGGESVGEFVLKGMFDLTIDALEWALELGFEFITEFIVAPLLEACVAVLCDPVVLAVIGIIGAVAFLAYEGYTSIRNDKLAADAGKEPPHGKWHHYGMVVMLGMLPINTIILPIAWSKGYLPYPDVNKKPTSDQLKAWQDVQGDDKDNPRNTVDTQPDQPVTTLAPSPAGGVAATSQPSVPITASSAPTVTGGGAWQDEALRRIKQHEGETAFPHRAPNGPHAGGYTIGIGHFLGDQDNVQAALHWWDAKAPDGIPIGQHAGWVASHTGTGGSHNSTKDDRFHVGYMTEKGIDELFKEDAADALKKASMVPNFDYLDVSGKAAIADASYLLGSFFRKKHGHYEWQKFLDAMRAGNFSQASADLLDSQAAKLQAPRRMKEDAAALAANANIVPGVTRKPEEHPDSGSGSSNPGNPGYSTVPGNAGNSDIIRKGKILTRTGNTAGSSGTVIPNAPKTTPQINAQKQAQQNRSGSGTPRNLLPDVTSNPVTVGSVWQATTNAVGNAIAGLYNIAIAVAAILSNAKSKYTGACLHNVRVAIQKGIAAKQRNYINTYLSHTSDYACNFGPCLLNIGFSRVSTNCLPAGGLRNGDVAVMQKCPKHKAGHICMWTPQGWVSDTVQKNHHQYAHPNIPGGAFYSPYPASAYAHYLPRIDIYRHANVS